MILKNLKNSKNPLILAGIEINRYELTDIFKKFIEKTDIPYSTTFSSKGLLNEEHDCYIGTCLGKSSNTTTREYFEKADLIFLIGVTVTENDLLGMSMEHMFETGKKFICASRNSVKMEHFHFGQVTIKDLMTTLIKKFEDKEINPFKNLITKKDLNEEEYIFDEKDNVTYDSTIHMISKSNIMKDNIIICDPSLSLYPISTLKIKKDQILSQMDWCSKGYSLSASIGINCVENKKRNLIFIGDGGFQQNPQALSTLVKMKSKSIVFVFNNNLLGIEQWSTNPNVFKKHDDKVDSYNLLRQWDYVKFAQSVGCEGFTVNTNNEFKEILKKLENIDKPTLIELVIPHKDLPSLTKWKVQKE